MTFRPRVRAGKPKKCWCGSGKKQKNCHGLSSPPNVSARPAKQSPPSLPKRVAQPPWGVPGEEHQLWVVPLKKGEKPPDSLRGTPGEYKVQILLSRPGFPYSGEWEHKFIDDVIGDSYVAITKPLSEREEDDDWKVFLQANFEGRQVAFVGLPNDKGFLGKLVVEKLTAANFHDAEATAYRALAPFLSAWSLHLDIPVNVETVQVTELATHRNSLRVRSPILEMAFAGGASPVCSEDFGHYSSLYREALNSNSAFYRFLCFYKIAEAIPIRRAKANETARSSGQQIQRHPETLPGTREELLELLKSIYPWRTAWDDFALSQMIPDEAKNKRIGWVREKYLNPLRTGIAHALLKTGEVRVSLDNLEHIQNVNKWLPLCRIIARVMLRHEFPSEFDFVMTPLDAAESMRMIQEAVPQFKQ